MRFDQRAPTLKEHSIERKLCPTTNVMKKLVKVVTA